MKMRLRDRLLVRLGSLLTMLAGGVSIAGGVLLRGIALGDSLVMKSIPLALFVAGVLSVLVSLVLIVLPRRYAPHRRAFVVQPTELGELRIAVSALENLILKCVETHREVKVLHMAISNRRGAVNVDMHVSMNSNVSIPHAVEQMQTQIKRYIAASSGIEVRGISVSVERASGDENALPRESLPTAEVPAAELQEKVPVHQRVFGRDPKKPISEQVAEAEMIAPPAEEKAAEEAPAAEKPVEEAPVAAEAQEAPAENAQDAEGENVNA